MLVGPSGCGKTTILTWCAHKTQNRLQAQEDDEDDLSGLFSSCTRPLRKGKFVALIDTVEGLSQGQRSSVREALHSPTCKIILTADNHFDSPAKNFVKLCKVVMVEKRNDSKAEDRVRHVIKATAAGLGQEFCKDEQYRKILNASNGNLAAAVRTTKWGIQTIAARRRIAEAIENGDTHLQLSKNFDAFDHELSAYNMATRLREGRPLSSMGASDVGFAAVLAQMNLPNGSISIDTVSRIADRLCTLDVCQTSHDIESESLLAHLNLVCMPLQNSLKPAGYHAILFPRGVSSVLRLQLRAATQPVSSTGTTDLQRLELLQLMQMTIPERLVKGHEYYHKEEDVRKLLRKDLWLETS